MRRLPFLLGLAAAACTWQTSDTEPFPETVEAGDIVCGIGDTRACVCPGAVGGAQACLPDRSGFGTCDCPDAQGDGDGGATPPGEGEGGGSEGEGEGEGEGAPQEGEGEGEGAPCVPAGEACNGADDDCDGVPDNGTGGAACAVPDGAGQCGVGEEQCRDGGLLCVAVNVPVDEQCNGLDDDCDGRVDEGFDLANDDGNCGGCGRSCAADRAETACSEGVCVLVRCEAGYVDLDARLEDGCEAESGGRTLHVREGAPAPGNGSAQSPFPTIQAALAAAQANDVVSVAEGYYAGQVVVATEGVRVRGAGRDQVVVQPGGASPAVRVTGDYASVETLTVDGNNGAAEGVVLECDAGCAAIDLVVTRVRAPAPDANWDRPGVPAYGIRVAGAEWARVAGNAVGPVTAGAAWPACYQRDDGGAGAGLALSGARAALVHGNTVTAVSGGAGGRGPTGGCAAMAAGSGGKALGIQLAGVADSRVTGNAVRTLRGGAGAAGYGWDTGRRGGLAIGMHLSGSQHNVLGSNTLADLGGGAAGGSEWGTAGRPGWAVGVFLEPDAYANTVADTNVLEGEPVVYLHGARGRTVEGYVLAAATRPTNLGKVVLIDCDGVVVRGNEVGGYAGGAGESSSWVADPGGAGEPAAGIRVLSSTAVAVVDNVVHDVTGGDGGGASKGRNGGLGGRGAGVWVEGCQGGCRVVGNRVERVTGGAGGQAGFCCNYGTGTGGAGGAAAAVYVKDSPGAVLEGNTVSRVTAGAGGPPGPGGGGFGGAGSAAGIAVESSGGTAGAGDVVHHVEGGTAAGVQIDGSNDCSLSNTLIYLVTGGTHARGVAVQGGSQRAALADLTLYRVEGGTTGAGVLVADGCRASVTGSIVSRASHHGLWSGPGNLPAALAAAHTDVWSSGEALANVLAGDGMLAADPLFVAPDGRVPDFSLRPDSPCVDAGDPGADCGEEPTSADGSCRRDLGHLAGTAGAAAR